MKTVAEYLGALWHILHYLVVLAANKSAEIVKPARDAAVRIARVLTFLALTVAISPLVLIALGLVLKRSILWGAAGLLATLFLLTLYGFSRPIISLWALLDVGPEWIKRRGGDISRGWIQFLESYLLGLPALALFFGAMPFVKHPGALIAVSLALVALFVIGRREKWLQLVFRSAIYLYVIALFVGSCILVLFPQTVERMRREMLRADERGVVSVVWDRLTGIFASYRSWEHEREVAALQARAAEQRLQERAARQTALLRREALDRELAIRRQASPGNPVPTSLKTGQQSRAIRGTSGHAARPSSADVAGGTEPIRTDPPQVLHASITRPAGPAPEVWQEDMYGGWHQVFQHTDIPSSRDQSRFRLVCQCNIERDQTSVTYDGVPIGLGGNWEFGVPNRKDGGSHLLVIRVSCRVAEGGYATAMATLSVINNSSL